MIQGLYAVKNVLSNIYSGLYLFPTDKAAAVELAINLAPPRYSTEDKRKFITSELELHRVGHFNVETGEIMDRNTILIPWDFRRFIVETPMDVHTGTAQEQEIQFQKDVADI